MIKRIYLNRNWDFNNEKVDIPHTVREIPYNYCNEDDYQGEFIYENITHIDSEYINKNLILTFEGVAHYSEVYINDKLVITNSCGYNSFNVNIKDYVNVGDNKIKVLVNSKEDLNIPPFGNVIDYLTYGGIYRDVYLDICDDNYVKDCFIKPKCENGIWSIDLDIELNKDSEYLVEIYFKDELVIKNKYDKNNINIVFNNPKLWDIDNPILYTLKTVIKSDDGEETYINRFGFRNAEFRRDGFFLNEQKIKLTGLNRHQGYPYVGYAMPKCIQEDDAELLKNELGVNIVRTSHYPQSEHFLNKCDELGLLVVNEIPGWQHIGKDKVWRDNFMFYLQQMVKTQRNHPALIAHGVRIDESQDDHELYLEANKVAHQLDPTRQTLGVRNFKNSELLEDIYAYNDFSCDSMRVGLINPKGVKTHGKPYLVTEYMGHMDPVKPTSDERTKVEVALRHAKVIDDNFKYQNIAGAIGWCAFDYHTHVDFGSGDHICPHGAYDLYRNSKHTAAVYASQNDKTPMLEVISDMKPGDYPEARYFDIYVCTNCDYFDLFKNDEFVARYYPKRDQFKYMPHPPILVDDLVGKTFKEKRFKEKSWPRIAKMFTHAATQGFNALTLKERLYLAFMMSKYKVTYAELVDLYNTYVGSWGGIAKTYTFKGYKNDTLVVEKKVGPSKSFDLDVHASKEALENKETYDALSIHVKHIDENGSLMQYSNRVIHIEVSGPVKVLGDEYQSLLGGQLTLYVLSENKSGKAKIKISMDDVSKEIDVEVK